MNKHILSSVSQKRECGDTGLLGNVALHCCYDFRGPLTEAGETLNASSGTASHAHSKSAGTN